MQQIVDLTAVGLPASTTAVTGAGNFAAYFDFSAMQAGDAVQLDQLVDVVGTSTPRVLNSATFTAEDLAIASEEGGLAVPVTLEADQTLQFSLTLTAGTAPLAVPVRTTNIQTGA